MLIICCITAYLFPSSLSPEILEGLLGSGLQYNCLLCKLYQWEDDVWVITTYYNNLIYLCYECSWWGDGFSCSAWDVALGIWLCWAEASYKGCVLGNGFHVRKVIKYKMWHKVVIEYCFSSQLKTSDFHVLQISWITSSFWYMPSIFVVIQIHYHRNSFILGGGVLFVVQCCLMWFFYLILIGITKYTTSTTLWMESW